MKETNKIPSGGYRTRVFHGGVVSGDGRVIPRFHLSRENKIMFKFFGRLNKRRLQRRQGETKQ